MITSPAHHDTVWPFSVASNAGGHSRSLLRTLARFTGPSNRRRSTVNGAYLFLGAVEPHPCIRKPPLPLRDRDVVQLVADEGEDRADSGPDGPDCCHGRKRDEPGKQGILDKVGA